METEDVSVGRMRKSNCVSKLSIVVPCFNERDGLDQLVERLKSVRAALQGTTEVEVILVDDGSVDDTATELKKRFSQLEWARVICHETNQGIAQAILTGINLARHEFVASIDADCTYDPLQLCQLINSMDDSAAMVTASPYHPRGTVEGVPSWRLALSRAASGCYSILLSARLHTYTSCFRIYRKSWFQDISLQQTGFVGIAEMLWIVDRKGGRIIETPARLTSRRIGYSKMRTFPVIWGHFKLMMRIAAIRSVSPFITK